MFTSDLLELLMEDEEAPRADWRKGKGLTANSLSGLLRPFGIRSHGSMRIGDKTLKGYQLADFTSAFARYLPSEPSHPSQPASTNGLRPISFRHNGEGVTVVPEGYRYPHGAAGSRGSPTGTTPSTTFRLWPFGKGGGTASL